MVKVNESKHEDVHEHGPQSSMSSDGSFVVLERSPPQESSSQFASHVTQQPTGCSAVPPHNSYIAGLSQLEIQNSSFVPGSLPTDLSPEEIQRKLQELLQENLELKETLRQNNLAMKQQFNTLAMWQEEVFKAHQNHKAKFAETKELVLKLRAENAELKNILEASKKPGSAVPSASETELMMENVELKGRIAELQQKLSSPMPRKEQLHSGPPSKKEQELSALLEQVNRQLETAERARRQLTVDVEWLTSQKARLERDMVAQKAEIEEQKEQLQKSQKEKEELEQKITQLIEQHRQELHDYALIEHQQQQQVSSPPVGVQQSNTQGIERLVSQLDEQKAQINVLTHQLKEAKAKVAAVTVGKDAPGSVHEQAAIDLRDCEETLEHMNNCLDKENERFCSLDSWLQVASDSMNHWRGKQYVDIKTLNTLKAEIQELRNLLVQEKASNLEKKKNLEEAQEKFRNLHSDYQLVVKKLQNFHEEQKDKDHHNNAYHEVQARGFTEKIDSMTAQLLNKEEALTQKNKELIQLKEKMKKLELENEAITILKAQVEVYQSDFNAEREARENLAGEKERLAEDLRHLQRRNQQLLDELEAYQQNQFEQMQRQTPPHTAPTTPFVILDHNTLGTPRQAEPQRPARSSPVRSSPGRISPRRPSPSEQQQHPLPTAEQDEQLYRVEPENVYYCPKCSMRFSSLPPLEHHVEECLDLLA